METRHVDTVVLGAGSAGLVARRTAEKAGASTLMIDPGPWGTTCARVGCMPSKLLIAAAEVAHHAARASVFGVHTSVTIDRREVMDRVRRERDRFVGTVLSSTKELESEGKLIQGRGRFVEPTLVRVDDAFDVRAKAVVVATGSRPTIPEPYRHLSKERLLTTDTLFELAEVPTSVLVVGSGAIGLELGQALARLGTRVTIIGVGGAVGPLSDPTVRRAALEIFRAELDIDVDTTLVSIEEVDDGVRARFSGEAGKARDERYEYVLLAAGRVKNLDGIGLSEAGVETNEEGMPAWDPATTQIDGVPIFVAGDASDHHPTLHEAAAEGRIAGKNAATFPDVLAHRRHTPLAIVFTDPQIAVVGDSARALDCDAFRLGEVDYADQGRARVMGQNRGVVRVYGERRTELLVGAEMLGPRVEHTAHLLAWAIEKRTTVSELLEMPFYHPVIEEGIRTALRDLQQNLRVVRTTTTTCEDLGPGT